MGPALVATMVQADSEESKARKLHPFFTRAPENSAAPKPAVLPEETPEDASTDREAGRGRKKRESGDGLPTQEPAPKKRRAKRASGRPSLNGSITDHLTKPDVEPVANATEPEHIPTPPPSDISSKTNDQIFPLPIISPPRPSPQPEHRVPNSKTKVLKFNPKTGTLGSPPKPKSRIVTVKYGHDDGGREEIGRKITQILEGICEPPKTPTKRRRGVAKKSQARPVEECAETTRSSFTGKATSPADPPAPKSKTSPVRRHTISMATPVSPKKQRNPFLAPKTSSRPAKPVGTKVPGAMHPAWPSQGMQHVTGIEGESRSLQTVWNAQLRKFKGQVVHVGPEESVVQHEVRRLDLQSVRDSLPGQDQIVPAPKELRLPTRRFESGRKLQGRIRQELRTLQSHHKTQGGADADEAQSGKVHPAVARLYRELETGLSAYDRSTCDNCAWSQKYAPATAAQVLQAGKEAFYLKEWLEALKVQSVETGTGEGTSKGKPGKTARKRRRNKLDGFVVDSDDEEYDLDEVSEDETDWTPAGPGRPKKTVIRHTRKDQGRLPNAVLVSGPYGSGKTAAIYAVAKELGFEIFEINSGSRRSGKDLLERVGDMTRNHLVHQHQAEAADADDGLAEDINSGKQGMMTAFFKPKPGAQGKPTKTKAKEQRPAHKAQKQSLILLEEVDILYEEDRQFWGTLMGMIAQSRRPFIMTCNDENLIPIQSLTLSGILRFSPPPADLAADVCLLVAANEGHALERSAIEALYHSRGYDLRATITELNYWCQLGVGDRRGGFDWFYLRWPKGSDLDENGDTVRVISDKTYVKGMGWIARDALFTANGQEMEEEAMQECWESWQLALGDWHSSLDMQACAASMPESDHGNLDAYDRFCQSLSDSDLCSNSAFGATLQDIVDPSLPELPAKTKEDFVVGRQLLDAEPVRRPSSQGSSISISLSSLARADLFNYIRTGSSASSILAPIGEDKATATLDSWFQAAPTYLTRHDIALAFDPIAVSDTGAPTSHLDPSVFDRTLKLIVLDIAPWVRSIVSYDHRLMYERKKLSSLISEGGQRKRMRNTRSAYSALEGGERRSTRREKYFQGSVSTALVLNTGLKAWQDAAEDASEDKDPTLSSDTECLLDSE